ncbi:MAG: DUF1893 domain-containing protein [Lentimicrobiaceae bacterium]|nr:DUF1893 domain-containing protein [Lentimicrobiaceae bacterium]
MNINDLKEILLNDNHTIVIYKNDASVFVSDDRGVVPLMKLLQEDKSQLLDSIVVDKVIGKAAALLMVFAGVKEVFTPTISSPAVEVFKNHDIKITFDSEVDRIINRKGDGLCPMETLCLDIDNPEEAFFRISRFQEIGNRGIDS